MFDAHAWRGRQTSPLKCAWVNAPLNTLCKRREVIFNFISPLRRSLAAPTTPESILDFRSREDEGEMLCFPESLGASDKISLGDFFLFIRQCQHGSVNCRATGCRHQGCAATEASVGSSWPDVSEQRLKCSAQ